MSHFFSGCRHLLPVSNKAALPKFRSGSAARPATADSGAVKLSNATAAFSRC